MSNYQVTHTTKYTYSGPASVCRNKVRLAPRSMPSQQIHDFRLTISPEPTVVSSRTDYFGNQVDYFSIPTPHMGLTVTATSQLSVVPRANPIDAASSPAWETVAHTTGGQPCSKNLTACQFVFPSTHARRSEDYAAYARQSFQPGRPIVQANLDLTRRIHQDFKYDPRATTISTPVSEVFEKRAGVCQDFAHLQISCLRSLGLPARYVSGYLRTIPPPGKQRLVGADASHAWTSLYCGALGWIDFDPTNDMIPATDHITIGWGLDYRDLCPIQGVFVGGGQSTMTVSVDVMPTDPIG